MNKDKLKRLEAAGFKATTVGDFLGLSPEESAIVEMKLLLSSVLRQRRGAAELSQAALAERMHSSQSRIAKAEAGDPSVTMDLLIRAVLATGATRVDLGQAIASGDPSTLFAAASAAKGMADLDEAIEEMLVDNADNTDNTDSESERELVTA